MKRVWLFVTIIGTVFPYYFFYNQVVSLGFGWSDLPSLIFPTYAATGFVVDLIISSFVFWIYIYKKIDKRLFLQIVVINLTIGLSAAFPYYLFKTFEKNRNLS